MAREKVFVDTAFAQGLINARDQYHEISTHLYPRMLKAIKLVTTEIVLIEIADAFSSRDTSKALEFIEDLRNLGNTEVISIDTILFEEGLELYRTRPDKTWGLTDCISFVVMQNRKLKLALTTDQHFLKAGFRALMLEL